MHEIYVNIQNLLFYVRLIGGSTYAFIKYLYQDVLFQIALVICVER